jgi:hypothetical protein
VTEPQSSFLSDDLSVWSTGQGSCRTPLLDVADCLIISCGYEVSEGRPRIGVSITFRVHWLITVDDDFDHQAEWLLPAPPLWRGRLSPHHPIFRRCSPHLTGWRLLLPSPREVYFKATFPPPVILFINTSVYIFTKNRLNTHRHYYHATQYH